MADEQHRHTFGSDRGREGHGSATRIGRGRFRGSDRAGGRPSPPPSTPIHRVAADADGAHGIWTAGRDFKASFHDGFSCYRVLGDAYPLNLPFRRNRTVLPAGVADPADFAPVRFSDQRFERPLGGGVTEVYDVRTDAIEQSFVIERPPTGRVGDLVLAGMIDATLRVVDDWVDDDGIRDVVGEGGVDDEAGGVAVAAGSRSAHDTADSRIA